ncbi:MAG TPA: HAMP domain-containing sensor histidine kinase, partial [Spirochaetales bacterium]|nr:HAMP domain-containing sensor histidine kinase [Spirochaetales bacterium]
LLERYADEFEPERVKELAGQVASQARRTAGLLEDILSWARSQTGGLAPAPTDFVVVELLDEIVSLYARPAGERRIGLEVECPSELRARADRSMVATVLRNLCSNAVRHIAAGGSVWLSARATDGGVEVEVSDTGPGMDAETLRSILETGAARRRSATAGSGLGLALAREFASRAGGGLVIESSPEAGSRISVTLAAAPAD